MFARDVMVDGVVTVAPEASIREVLALFVQHRIGGIPVVGQDGELMGIISDGDILKQIRKKDPVMVDLLTSFTVLEDRSDLGDKVQTLLERKVREVMTARVHTVMPDTPLTEVAAMMTDRKIKRIPVVDEKNRLLGIISRGDMIRGISSQS